MCVNFPLCPDYLQGEIGLASQTSEHILTHSWPIRCFGCEGNLQFILGGPSVATVCLTHSRGNSPLPLLPVFSPSNQLQPLSQSNYSNFTCFSVYIVPMIYFSRWRISKSVLDSHVIQSGQIARQAILFPDNVNCFPGKLCFPQHMF